MLRDQAHAWNPTGEAAGIQPFLLFSGGRQRCPNPPAPAPCPHPPLRLSPGPSRFLPCAGGTLTVAAALLPPEKPCSTGPRPHGASSPSSKHMYTGELFFSTMPPKPSAGSVLPGHSTRQGPPRCRPKLTTLDRTASPITLLGTEPRE